MSYLSKLFNERQSFTVQFVDGNVRLLNEFKRPCTPEETNRVVTVIAEAFIPGAYIYVGRGIITDVRGTKIDCHKIGVTHDIDRTKQELKIDIIHQIPCPNSKMARTAEYLLHTIFEEQQVQGEWFELCSHDLIRLKAMRSFIDVIDFYIAMENPTTRFGYSLERLKSIFKDVVAQGGEYDLKQMQSWLSEAELGLHQFKEVVDEKIANEYPTRKLLFK